MKLLLLGATGRTGKLVLDYALACDHKVNCLARKSERIAKRNGLTIFDGDTSLESDLKKAARRV